MESEKERVFETGAVRDLSSGKGRCDLLPLLAMQYIIKQGKDHVSAIAPAHHKVYDLANIYYTFHNYLQGDKSKDNLVKIIYLYARVSGSSLSKLFLQVAHRMEEGVKKYPIRNWEKGIPRDSYVDSAIRHLLRFLNGEHDEDHESAFLWNVTCLLESELRGLYDDTKVESK